MRSVEVKDPVFEETPDHDVVAKCPNGKIRGRSTAAIYVVIRIDLEGNGDAGVDADVLAYSYDPDFGCPFIETVAAKDAFGKFWDFKKHGSPCFDPIRDDGTVRDPPLGRFMCWDELDEPTDGMPTMTQASLTIYEQSGTKTGENDKIVPVHRPIRRYKLSIAQLTINDFVAIESDGDRLFLK